MASFTFHNLHEHDLQVVIEPWAMAECVRPGESVLFEVADAPPPDIEFAASPDGSQYVYVMSEHVRILANGKEHVFRTDERPEALNVLCRMMNGVWN